MTESMRRIAEHFKLHRNAAVFVPGEDRVQICDSETRRWFEIEREESLGSVERLGITEYRTDGRSTWHACCAWQAITDVERRLARQIGG